MSTFAVIPWIKLAAAAVAAAEEDEELFQTWSKTWLALWCDAMQYGHFQIRIIHHLKYLAGADFVLKTMRSERLHPTKCIMCNWPDLTFIRTAACWGSIVFFLWTSTVILALFWFRPSKPFQATIICKVYTVYNLYILLLLSPQWFEHSD